MKVCVDCKKKKREDQFYFRPNYHNTDTVYRMSQCKECSKERTYRWVAKNRERHNDYQRTYNKKKRSTSDPKPTVK